MTEGRIGENIGRTQGEQDQECSASQAQFHPLCLWGTVGRPSAFPLLPLSFLRCARSLPSLCTLALAILSVGCWYPAFYYTSLITLPPTRNHGTLAHVRWGIIHLGLHPRSFLGVSASQSWFHHCSTLNATAFCVILFPGTHFLLLYASWNISS